MDIPGGVGGGRSSASGCMKKGNRSLALVNSKQRGCGVREACVGDEGKGPWSFWA